MSGPFMVWQDSYSVGHAVIDGDHQRLMGIFNRLAAEAANGASEDVLNDIFFDLVDYVEQHFAREEILFLNARYPDAEKHMLLHRALEAQVHDMANSFRENPSGVNIDNVLVFLREWLTNHILKSDLEIVEFIVAERDKSHL